jgi:predicted anti-sigma-YlaC factor YlaD
MFGHARVQRLLSAYHDGELSPAVTARIELHLQVCSSCRKEYQHLAMATNAVRHLPRMEAPASLARMIRARIDEEVRGMVPIFRDELLSCRSRPILVPALSLGALLTMCIIGGVLLYGLYQTNTPPPHNVGLVTTSVAPVFLEVEMVSPRVRQGCVKHLPYSEMERGKAGTLLTFASIDQEGAVHGLHVIDRSGDEQMLSLALEALRSAGFEPARVGDQNVAINFLYLFTTTEVRLPPDKFISDAHRPHEVAS